MTPEEFNRRVSEDIRRMIERDQRTVREFEAQRSRPPTKDMGELVRGEDGVFRPKEGHNR